MTPFYAILRFCLTLLLLANIVLLRAQSNPPLALGAKVAGLGRAYVGVSGSFWNLFYNPAGLAGIEGAELGISYENRFLLSELSLGSVGFALPFAEEQAIGIDASSYGFEAYRENQMGVSYAIRVLDHVSLGAKLNYSNLNISEGGSHSTVFLTVGVITEINPQLSLGFQAYNVTRSQIETQNGVEEDLPLVLSTGLAYTPTEKVLLVIDMQKDLDHPISFRGGVEYAFVDAFVARVGISNEPLTYNMGFGVILDSFRLDASFGYQDQLGYIPSMSLSYRFFKN